MSEEDGGLVRKRSGRTVMGGTVHPLVYGPVDSRRYGRSLGVNLLPPDVKHCNFDCGYCQLGWTDLEAMRERALRLNPDIQIFEISAKTGQGVQDWAAWLSREVESFFRR